MTKIYVILNVIKRCSFLKTINTYYNQQTTDSAIDSYYVTQFYKKCLGDVF